MNAERISHSTSHAESLGMYNVALQAEQLAMRLTGLTSPEQLDLKDFIRVEKAGNYDLPIDVLCDCNDVLELVTGKKGVPQDKSQRLIILSLRERRLMGRSGFHIHIRTQDMVCNCLTKHAPCEQILKLLLAGCIEFHHPMVVHPPCRLPCSDISGSDLLGLKD